MNCEDAQRLSLLAGTDELSDREHDLLAEHLSICDECRTYQAETANLLSAVRDALPAPEPKAATLKKIHDAAERTPERRVIRIHHYRRALAYAATFMILLAGGYLYFNGSAENGGDPVANREAEISAIADMMMVSAEDELAFDYDTGDSDGGEAGMRSLARQLLRLQGFEAEDAAVAEELILLEEPQPTDLRSHSTPEIRSGICV